MKLECLLSVAAVSTFILSGCGRAPSDKAGSSALPSPPVELLDGPRRPSPPAKGPRVIWIGLDGADYDYLDSLAKSGNLPNWSRLEAEGFRANLSTFLPILSPLIWTTEETGVGPDVHRVLDFEEVDAQGHVVPVSDASRKTAAVWNIASQAGKKVGVVGFWATHPAERVNGFFLSDRIVPFRSESSTSGTASPESLEDAVRKAVVRDGAASPAELSSYVDLPAAAIQRSLAAGADLKDPVGGLSKIIGSTRVTQRLARELYDREIPDLLAVYFEGTDEIGHVFAPYAPPKLTCTDAAAFAAFQRVPGTYFALVDRLLGQWMRRAREDGATLVVTSDHGFKWGSDRPCALSSANLATAPSWHEPIGVFLAWGANVPALRSSRTVSVFDVTPTLLALLDLPGDSRMTGTPAPVRSGLSFRREPNVLSRDRVVNVSAKPLDEKEIAEYTKKLVALGYLTPADARPASAVASVSGLSKGGWNNLGVYLYHSSHDLAGARRAWEQSLKMDPHYHSPLLNLGIFERDRGNLREATSWLLQAIAAGHPDPEGTVQYWASEFEKKRPGAGIELLRQAHEANPGNEFFARNYALELSRKGRCREAEVGPLENSKDPETLNVAAIVWTCLDRPDRVGELLRKSLALNPNQPRVREAIEALPH